MHSPLRNIIPVETLLLAYRSGIFPMADKREDQDVFWVEPRDRAIIPLQGLRLSKSLKKTIRRDTYSVTINQAFSAVVEGCAAPRPGNPETWISGRIARSYTALHEQGFAHSIECWRMPAPSGDDPMPTRKLVGGLYGVAFDRVFCGESMFSRADNASKVALVWLVALMREAGYFLLDCQFMTDHLASMGAIELPQAMYLEALAKAKGSPKISLEAAFDRFSDPGGPYEEAASSSPGKRIAQSLIHTS